MSASRAVRLALAVLVATAPGAAAHWRGLHHPFWGGVVVTPFPPPPPPWWWYGPSSPPAPPEPPGEPEASGPPEDPLRWSYGLVQLRGVPDGAAVDLDGRFWMTAAQLDRRWLALPHGRHVIAVYVEGKQPVERRVDVAAGRTHFVRFGPFADVRA